MPRRPRPRRSASCSSSPTWPARCATWPPRGRTSSTAGAWRGHRRAPGGRGVSHRRGSGAHTGEWGEPIATTYRGYTVHETPPPTQGLAALLALQPARGRSRWRAGRCTPWSTCTRSSRWSSSPTPIAIDGSAIPIMPGSRSPRCSTRSTRRRAAGSSIRRRRGAYAPGQPEGDTTGFVVADGARQRAERDPEPVQRRSGPGWSPPGTGVLPPEPRAGTSRVEPGAPERAGAAQAARSTRSSPPS